MGAPTIHGTGRRAGRGNRSWSWEASGAVEPRGVGCARGDGADGVQAHHVPEATDGTLAQRCAGEVFIAVTIVVRRGSTGVEGGDLDPEEVPRLGELGLAHTVAEQAVVADAVEAVWAGRGAGSGG